MTIEKGNGNGDNVRIPKWIANIVLGIVLTAIFTMQVNTSDRIRKIELDIAQIKEGLTTGQKTIDEVKGRQLDNFQEHDVIRDWAERSFERKK